LAYLRWSDSNWYAHSHADGGNGDDAVFKAMHGSGPTLLVTAAELRRAGVQGDPHVLQNWMASMGGFTDRVLADVGELSPAVDQFLFETYNAGKVMMPPELARRYRVLRRLLRRNAERGSSNRRRDAEGWPVWAAWFTELREIDEAYPPPAMSPEIKELHRVRAVRVLTGQKVSAEQDAHERKRIADEAWAWPPYVRRVSRHGK
jgi:hypothetical protein